MTDTGDTAARPALPRHLYVHVPLCRSRCRYCDFHTRVARGPDEPERVASALGTALSAWYSIPVGRAPLQTLYVGGGTPTVLGPHVAGLVAHAADLAGLEAGAEVTVEANPDSVDRALLEALAGAGVTRVSLGVQSLDDGTLRWLGRRHDAEAARRAMRAIASSGVDLAVDLMAGVPGDRTEALLSAIDEAVDAGAVHVSVYPLAVEDGTPLGAACRSGVEEWPDEDAAADGLIAASARLAAAGFERYEIASHALPGHRSRHNLAYWTGRPYLGVGAGAHGMLDGDQARALGLLGPVDGDTARVRYRCAPESDGTPASVTVTERLTATEAAREDAMLGLRVSDGITHQLAARAGVVAPLEALAAEGLVVTDGSSWRTTERGWLLGNVVFGRVLGGE